jgi:uncharacterized Zn finger protein
MVVTDEIIRSLSSPQSFARGLELYRSGALFSLERLDNLLLGKCEGTSAPSYDLQVQIDAGGIRSASCSR